MKKRLIIIMLILCTLIAAFSGCVNSERKTSSTQMNITQYSGTYSEEDERTQMAKKKEIAFAVNGESDYSILVPEDISEDLMASCNEFSSIFNRIVGSEDQFAVKGTRDNGKRFISVGDTKEARENNFDKSGIVYDGFLVKTDNLGNIYILANEENGLANGIYTLLEDVFGCMFVRDDYDYIPSFDTIYLDRMDFVKNPDFEWRKMFQYEVSENGWYKKLKNNGASADGVEVNEGWGTWCHSVFMFVDPAIYAKEHPEYFVFVDNEPRQLCLTNPDIYPIVEKKMEEMIRENPDKKYWDFSINDNTDYCKCDNCAKVLRETGSMMGTMLPIINRLARCFPDKMISTLAYTYNKEVPSGMTCEDNVNIVVAPIGTGQLYSYKYGDTKKADEAKSLIEDWGRIAKSVFVWDYVVDFKHLLLPFPNFDVQKDNHDFYIDNNVKAIFHQGSREHTNELACLRSYVLSRQMWDNTVDTDKIIAKYIDVTYGKGAPYIAEYLETMNDELQAKARDLDLYDTAVNHMTDYLSLSNVDKYLELINKARDAEDDEAIKSRVDEIRINVLYAKMNVPGLDIFEKREAFEEFKELVRKFGITRQTEVGISMDEYIEKEYPKTLRWIEFSIIMIAIAPVIIALTAFIVYRTIRNRKRAKKGEEYVD